MTSGTNTRAISNIDLRVILDFDFVDLTCLVTVFLLGIDQIYQTNTIRATGNFLIWNKRINVVNLVIDVKIITIITVILLDAYIFESTFATLHTPLK